MNLHNPKGDTFFIMNISLLQWKITEVKSEHFFIV